MTPKDLVLAAGRGEALPRTPVTPYMGNFAATLVGTPIDQYCTNAQTMAESQLAAQRLVGQDAVVAQSDGYYMAEAFGLRTRRRQNDTPIPTAPLVDDLAAVDRLTVPNPWHEGRMPVYLEAIRLLRQNAGARLAVRACGTGAFSLAGHLIGPDNLVARLALLSVEPSDRDEAALRRLMEICTETTARFAACAVDAGADIVMSGDSLASLDMISPTLYREWVWPYEREFFARIDQRVRRAGAASLLHICGNTLPIVSDMGATGADILEIDWKVPIAEAAKTVRQTRPDHPPAIMGNLDPSAILLQASESEVSAAAARAVSEGGTGFLLGSGCEVAPATPLANMRAIVNAAS